MNFDRKIFKVLPPRYERIIYCIDFETQKIRLFENYFYLLYFYFIFAPRLHDLKSMLDLQDVWNESSQTSRTYGCKSVMVSFAYMGPVKVQLPTAR